MKNTTKLSRNSIPICPLRVSYPDFFSTGLYPGKNAFHSQNKRENASH